jgi:TPR repeat protein
MLRIRNIFLVAVSLFFLLIANAVVKADMRFQPTEEVLGYMKEANQALEYQDYQKAHYFLKRATEHGYPEAQMKMGMLYKNGWGVPQDYDEAIYWVRMSADQRFPMGLYELALLYKAKDELMESNYWFNLAYLYGDSELRNLIDAQF